MRLVAFFARSPRNAHSGVDRLGVFCYHSGEMKKIIILGCTGSIGTSAVDVLRAHPGDFRAVALACRSNRELAERQAAELGAKAYVGEDSAVRAIEENEADVALVSTVGLSGLAPTLAAVEKGMDVALATKEVMVAAGEFVTALARERGVKLIPVDSEHSAIFQSLQSYGNGEVDQSGNRTISRLILTASGGPFLDGPADLSAVTPAQALNHPRWKMGPKVTIDSSTMMNKGFEILEARWLFGIPVSRIDVVVHPESIVHSLVEFTDGSTIAQLAPPDMRVPIQYAFTWPGRLPAERAKLDLAELGALHFRAPDEGRFPCLRLVREANALGGIAPAVLSAADEIAVERFVKGEIGYTDIPRIVEAAVSSAPKTACDSLDAVFEADRWARSFAASMLR